MSDFPMCGDVPLLPRPCGSAEEPQSPDVVLVLRDVPGATVPHSQRLKRLLKACLRVYGFRLVEMAERPRGPPLPPA